MIQDSLSYRGKADCMLPAETILRRTTQSSRMIDTLIRTMEEFSRIGPVASNELRGHCLGGLRVFGPRVPIFRSGSYPDGAYLVLAGIACRHTHLREGKRPVSGLLLPGDVFGLRSLLSQRHDHDVSTLAAVQAVFFSKDTLCRWSERLPRLIDAFWRTRLRQSQLEEHWIANVGPGNSIGRVARILWELYLRLHSVGLAHSDCCATPMTQVDLADMVALTPVHVNRTLARLSQTGIATFRHNMLVVHNFTALTNIAGVHSESPKGSLTLYRNSLASTCLAPGFGT
ncbi:MAG: transcriptional regulator, Crp/Fnr family [Gammaproteobacteria bacterium]|nr:transcriptional regulator, Crp/Fnr family [Gammaproteobacteria bacterium]